jgi:hypothetical protein
LLKYKWRKSERET